MTDPGAVQTRPDEVAQHEIRQLKLEAIAGVLAAYRSMRDSLNRLISEVEGMYADAEGQQ